MSINKVKLIKLSLIIVCLAFFESVFAAKSAGQIASQITESFGSLGRLITAGAYLGGLGFSIASIMKFKQHKDNPTQVPIGTPIALVFIAAALLFLPSLLGVTGQTIFGDDASVAGDKGQLFTTGS